VTPIAQFKLIACAVLLAVAAFLIFDYTTLRGRNEELRKENAETKDKLNGEIAARETMASEFITREEFDAAIRDARRASQSRINEVSHEDSPAGDLLRTRLPDGMRDAHFGR
jgi:C4-dicarboxylate-specific signal transduction histidine kinase